MVEKFGEIIPNNAEKEEHEPILNKDDEKVVEFALHELKELLSKKEIKDLPSTIVLTDVSARVLYYAIKPIIENVYKNKKELPQYYFLSAVRKAEIVGLNTYKDENDLEEITEGIYERETIDCFITSKKVGERKFTRPKTKIRENIDYEGWKNAFKDRFAKILDYSPEGNILVVDDYLSRGETIKKIKKVAKELLPADRKLEYFVFFDNDCDEIDKKTSRSIHSGTTSRELDSVGTFGKELKHFNAFSFTNKFDSPFAWKAQTKSNYIKSEVVGVQKSIDPNETVIPSEKINIEGMKQLREEMKAIAEKVLADKNFDKKSEISKLENYHPEI